jgi:hypothetical protein
MLFLEMSPSEYKVSFGQVARTILYEDSFGTLCFVFDVSPSIIECEKEWTFTLNKAPLTLANGRTVRYERDSPFDQERAETALRRIEEWASSRGYYVSVE